MAKAKRKTEQIKKKKTSTQKVISPDLESLAKVEFWRADIEALKDKEFSSIEMAINDLADAIIKKFSFAEDPGVINFIKDIVMTEPTLEKEIRSILKIKE